MSADKMDQLNEYNTEAKKEVSKTAINASLGSPLAVYYKFIKELLNGNKSGYEKLFKNFNSIEYFTPPQYAFA